MRLVPLAHDELILGAPVPWMLFDAGGGILMEQGAIVETLDDLDALLALEPYRDASNSNQNDSIAELPQTAYEFADMRLRVGDRMQLEPPSAVSADRHMIKVIGYLDNTSLLTTAPVANGLRVPLRDGDKVVIRVFANQNAFAFDTFVLRVVKIPFDYLHLEFPTRIQGAVIRKSPRVKTRLITTISRQDAQGAFPAGDDPNRKTGILLNLSADGALLEAKTPLTEKGGLLRIAFRVNLHNADAMITTTAVVRSIFTDEAKLKEGKAGGIMHGLQFQNVPTNDAILLQSMIYQKMIEHPHLLA